MTPDTSAALVLRDAWVPTGAAGSFSLTRNLCEASIRFAANARGRIWPIVSLRGSTVSVAFGGKADFNQRVGVVDSAGSDTPAAPVVVGAAGYFRFGLRCAPSGLQRVVTFYETSLDIHLQYSCITVLAPMKDVARRHTASWERGRCPRVGLQPAPGRLGHHVSRHYDRGGRCIPGLGQAKAGNARSDQVPYVDGLKLSLWDEILP
jgi:hypothetical protein